jgi:hypothetical protein
MTDKETLKLALEALGLYQAAGFGNSTDFNKQHEAFYKAQIAITAIQQAVLAAPVQEPFGYLFQHEETGLTTVVDVQQVEWGFEKNNPRHQKIGSVYITLPQNHV